MADTIRGLTDEQLADYEQRAEQAMLTALESVMNTIAAHLGATRTAGALVAHLPGKHDQRTHGHGGGGGGGGEPAGETGAPAEGEDALAAAPIGLDRPGSELTSDQQKAFEDYKSFFGYRRTNEGLRAGGVTGSTAETVRHMDSTMDSSPLSRDVRVYRGDRDGAALFGARFSGDLSGVTITNAAYLSTSASGTFARNWSLHGLGRESDPRSPLTMRITAPRGTKAVQLSGGDRGELLLHRGSRLRVTADHGVIDGVRTIDAEVLS